MAQLTNTCDICGTGFETRSNRDVHIKTIHQDPKSFKCKMCDYKTSQEVNLKGHVKRIHNREKTHVKPKANSPNKICKLCPSFFKRASELQKHQKTIHLGIPSNKSKAQVKIIKCSDCDYEGRKQHLKNHILSLHNLNALRLNCSMCDSKFKLKSNLKNHERTHLKIREKCLKCDLDYASKSQLRVHMRTVHEGIRYKCEACDYQSTQKGHLNSHTKRIHQKLKCFSCSICGNYFETKHGVEKHKVIHQEERELVSCPECNKEVYTRSLKSHIKEIHFKFKTIKCDKCDNMFKRKDHLRIHIEKVHEKNYVPCKHCQRTFAQKGYLNKHITKVHFPEKLKLLECSMCENKYQEKDALKKHIESKHISTVFKCEECGSVLSSSTNLRTHILDVHNGAQRFCFICSKDVKRNSYHSHMKSHKSHNK